MNIDWKANSSILMTGLVSIICWLIYVLAASSYKNDLVGGVFVILAIISLLRFGQLLDRSLKGTI